MKSLIMGLLFSTITSTSMYAAPFFCQANGTTLADKVLCDTLCGSTCQELLPNTANLNTCDTTKYNNFIGLNGKTYAVTKDPVWWEDVRSLLAVVKDEATNTILSKLITSESYIGAYDPLKSASYNQINSSRFKDKEGSILGYSNWGASEPNNYLPSADIGNVAIAGEHWAVIDSAGQWNDIGYHILYGGDYKPRRNAVVEWSNELACVSGITEHTTSDKTGFWCSSTEGNVAQCIVKTGYETPICNIGTWNTTTMKCESGGTSTYAARLVKLFAPGAGSCSHDPWSETYPQAWLNQMNNSGGDGQATAILSKLVIDIFWDKGSLPTTSIKVGWLALPTLNIPGTAGAINETFQSGGKGFSTYSVKKGYQNSISEGYMCWYADQCRCDRPSIWMTSSYTCDNPNATLSGTTCTVNTLVQTDGQCTTPSYTIQNGQCVGTYQGCPLGNYACTDITGKINDTDVTEGTADPQNDGEIDENGKCLGTIHIFSGRDNRCRPSGIQTGGTSCCKKGSAWFGLKECTEAEKALGKMREYGDLDGNCHNIGSYCSEKWPLIGCVQKKETYCCFSSPLARTMHEGGRPQLGITWGTPESPICRGFTIEEFQKIDFSKIDFSEWIKYELPNVQQGSITNIKNTIGNIQNVSTSTGQ